ncbi:hypothetical protein KP509_28G029300 [Ceratopteris richardii]|nr:hypothetical protein KP509_28G029300 [Ceratopteris richardii]
MLPSHDNFLCILLKCKRERSLGHLRRLHHLISDSNTTFEALGNYFVPAFIECGCVQSALEVFDKLHYKNEYSWTSLIQAHTNSGDASLAFKFYARMLEEQVLPNSFTFVVLLRACVHLKCIVKGRELHCEAVKEGYELDQFVASILVDLYAKCGSLSDAQDVFSELKERDTVLWTAMIAGYSEHGFGEDALKCFRQMQDEKIPRDAGTYVCILKACSSLEDIVTGEEIHKEVTVSGFNENPFLGNTLVYFYARVRKHEEAHTVFNRLSSHDVVTWNALLAGYSENKRSEQVLASLDQMRKEGKFSPNAVTLSCSLKACCSGSQAIDIGRGLHSEVLKKGYESEVVVGNTLVDMYSKCGFLTEAMWVFDNLAIQDIISWNTIFSAYAEHGLGMEGMNFYERMKSEHVSPTLITFVSSLKACGLQGLIDAGFILHTDITLYGLEKEIQVGNTLVDLYAKCGWLRESRKAFEDIGIHDVVSWNVLIAGYAERRLGEEVVSCFKAMQQEGVPPDALTYVFILKSCGDANLFEKCQKIHAEIATDGLEVESQVASSMLVLYSKCGMLLEAEEVFKTIPDRDVVCWTALISGHTEYGSGKEAVNYFHKMFMDGVSPNHFTYVYVLKACSKLKNIESCREVHSFIIKKGYEKDPFLCSALVDMYSKAGFLDDAHVLVLHLNVQDVVSWTALISGYAEHGSCEEALSCFEQLQHEGVFPDIILWNAILLVYSEKGEYEVVFGLYSQMQEQGVAPDSAMFVSILKACSGPAALEIGKKLHAIAFRGREEVKNPILMNAFIDMYGRCGSMKDAQQVFDALPVVDITSWNSICSGYARQGEIDLVVRSYHGMVQDGIQPDGFSFLNLLTACTHAGLVHEGCHCFQAMIKEYGIGPNIKHQTCLIDLFGRAGQLDEAVVAVENMPFEPDFVVWSAVLTACRKWGDVDLGRHSFDNALKSEEKNTGAFIMMYNIYSDAQMWAKAMEIHAMRAASWDNLNEATGQVRPGSQRQ